VQGRACRVCVCVCVCPRRVCSSVRVPLLGEGERLFSSPRAFASDGGSTWGAVRFRIALGASTLAGLRLTSRRHRTPIRASWQRGDRARRRDSRDRPPGVSPRSALGGRFRFIKPEFGRRGAANGAFVAPAPAPDRQDRRADSPFSLSLSLSLSLSFLGIAGQSASPVYCGNPRSAFGAF